MYFDSKPFVGYFMMMECADGCSITSLSIQTKHWLLVVFVFLFTTTKVLTATHS